MTKHRDFHDISIDIDGTIGDFEGVFGNFTIQKYGLPSNFTFKTPNYEMYEGGNWPQNQDQS